MNRPTHLRARLGIVVAGGALVAALFPMAGTALAASSVTPASGGGAISLDTSSAALGTGAYTSLTGPVVNEGSAGVFGTGTIVLTAPSGFEFNPSAGSVAKTGDCVIGTVSMTVTTATVSITTASTSTACVITFSNLGVRPTGTTVASGTITQTGGAANLPGGSYGALASVLGAPILTFTQQPSTSANGGAVLAQQPKVKSADRFGNERVGDPVTLAVNTYPTGGTLTCTANPVSTVNVAGEGIATFAGCALDKAGTYTLRATTPGQAGTIPVSGTIAISTGTANKLVFYQQPNLGVAGVAFPTQPIVGVADLGGHILASGFSGTVSLAITSNPGSGTLTCNALSVSTGLTSVGVLATFAGCRISNAGVGYTITASSSGLTSVTSAAFDVENQLVFFTQPAGAIAGAAFTTQPTVAVEVNSALAVHDSTTVVTLSIRPGTGATGATLSCTGGLSLAVSAGAATFTGCSIDKLSPSGNPYQLVATTSTGLGSVNSSSFAVTVGSATKVGFTTQPGNATVSATFPVSPVVAIQDAGGNTIATGTDSIRAVTLAIGTNPGGGTLTCTGGLTVSAVGGLATFTGCAINTAGNGYTLVATSTGLTSATSSAFLVGLTPATITLTRSHGMITYGESVTFSVQFGAGGANRPFVIQYTSVGVPWTTIANLVTNSSGFASMSYTPARTGYVRAVYAGATDLGASSSTVYIVGVRQTVSLNPHHAGVTAISHGTSVDFRTTVRPLRMDLLPTLVTFRFYQKVGGTWVLKVERHVATDTTGVARTTFTFSSSGNWYVRAYAPRTPYNSISRFTLIEYYSVL